MNDNTDHISIPPAHLARANVYFPNEDVIGPFDELSQIVYNFTMRQIFIGARAEIPRAEDVERSTGDTHDTCTASLFTAALTDNNDNGRCYAYVAINVKTKECALSYGQIVTPIIDEIAYVPLGEVLRHPSTIGYLRSVARPHGYAIYLSNSRRLVHNNAFLSVCAQWINHHKIRQ